MKESKNETRTVSAMITNQRNDMSELLIDTHVICLDRRYSSSYTYIDDEWFDANVKRVHMNILLMRNGMTTTTNEL